MVNNEEETVWINGAIEEELSGVQPHFVEAGGVGFGFQNAINWPTIRVAGAQVCTPVICMEDDGTMRVGVSSPQGEQFL